MRSVVKSIQQNLHSFSPKHEARSFSHSLLDFLDYVISRCPPGSVNGLNGTTRYWVEQQWMGFYAAEELCKTKGGSLASVNNAFENAFIANYVISCWAQGILWLGGVRNGQGLWSWTDGSSFTYQNWDKGQPATSGNCTVMVKSQVSGTGNWVVEDCDALKTWPVCEIPAVNTVVSTTPASQTCRPHCDRGWTYFEHTDSCYKVIHSYMNFLDAEELCESHQAHLASIHDGTENEFLVGLATTGDSVSNWTKLPWIGLNSIVTSFVYKWTGETPVDFVPWFSTNAQDNPRSCVALGSDEVDGEEGVMYRWVRRGCSELKRALICKKMAVKA